MKQLEGATGAASAASDRSAPPRPVKQELAGWRPVTEGKRDATIVFLSSDEDEVESALLSLSKKKRKKKKKRGERSKKKKLVEEVRPKGAAESCNEVILID